MIAYLPPTSTDQFNVAIICTSSFEANAIEALFDEKYFEEGNIRGKHPSDENIYVSGRISRHTVVLTQIPLYGKVAAAKASFWLSVSFPKIRLCLVVGTGAGIPYRDDHTEIFLGDVLISEGLIQYDFGKVLPDGVFLRKSGPKLDLSRPNMHVSAFLSKLRGWRSTRLVQERIPQHLDHLRNVLGDWTIGYPGAERDRLLAPSYLYRYHEPGDSDDKSLDCPCASDPQAVCEKALHCTTCEEANCSVDSPVSVRVRPVPRKDELHRSAVHFGWLASGDAYICYGAKRDEIAAKERVIGFEWAGVGVWENLPTIVITGVSNYGDGHQTEDWQFYASASASSCAKAVLQVYNGPRSRPSNSATEFEVIPSFAKQISLVNKLAGLCTSWLQDRTASSILGQISRLFIYILGFLLAWYLTKHLPWIERCCHYHRMSVYGVGLH